MKTLEDVKRKISENVNHPQIMQMSEREYKKLTRETEQLRLMARYLEHEPSEKSLIATKERFEKIIIAKNSQYLYWLKHNKPLHIEPKNALPSIKKKLELTC